MQEASFRAQGTESARRLSLHMRVSRTYRLEAQTMQLQLQAAQDIAQSMTEPRGSVSELRKRTTRLRVFKEKLRDALAYKAAPVDFMALLALERDGDRSRSRSPTVSPPRSPPRSPVGRLQRAVHRVCLESSSNNASPWDGIDVVAPTGADGPTPQPAGYGADSCGLPAGRWPPLGGDQGRGEKWRLQDFPPGSELFAKPECDQQEYANVVRSSPISLHSAQHACESEGGLDVVQRALRSELRGSPSRADSDGDNDSNGQESNPSNVTRSQQMEIADDCEHQRSQPNMTQSPHGANRAQEPSFTPEPTAHRSPPLHPTLIVSGHSRGRSVLFGSMLTRSLGRSPDALRVRAVREAFMRTGSKLAGATRGTRPRPASALQLSERGVKDVSENAFSTSRPAERRPRPASAAYPLQTRAPLRAPLQAMCRGRPCWVD
jgi:hypothetical protein